MKGKNLLISGSIDVVLIPVVVTTSDVDEFDYSIPVAKTWYVFIFYFLYYIKSTINPIRNPKYVYNSKHYPFSILFTF